MHLLNIIKFIFLDESNTNTDANAAKPPRMSEQEIEDMIDSILKDDDFNNDGFIDYSEFLRAQKERA